MRSRTLAAITAGLVLTAGLPASAAPVEDSGGMSGRFDRPHPGFAPEWTVLRESTPARAGLDPAPIDAALAKVEAWTKQPGSLFPGAVSLLVHDGKVVTRTATGHALRYADAAGTELPAGQQVPMRTDTIFDLASISKLFTSIAVMQQVEAGRVDLGRTVASYLPEFAANGKEAITVEQLLTHTSGLPPFLPLWRDFPDKASRIQGALTARLQQPPGKAYIYSDLNLIALGVLVEKVTGHGLDVVVRERITEPLGMRDTGYNPVAKDRTAATEFMATPPRGMVRGEVHDENAWSLGGVAGHAGVFSTADDLAVLGQAVLNGGTYRGQRILRERTLRQMLANHNPGFPDNAHGLGFELDQRWYMEGLSSPRTAGHTGFTGTSLVIDPVSRSVAVLLTNRVHPNRALSNNPARRALAQGFAAALAVRPKHGPDSWFSSVNEQRTGLLTARAVYQRGPARLGFDTFVDTEATDRLTVEASVDGGASWTPLALDVRGPGAPAEAVASLGGAGHRAWWRVSAELPAASSVTVRWRYASDKQYTGRGVFVDGVRITDRRGVLLDGEKDPAALSGEGWSRAAR
ncbi:CubicO group peptidase (beta-lactamase class C family) [Crossiella equi]|uniref:CubicO group peptidase (Beta-lactamase class C family) n=1 Tax=Crossiella equi TaxID=130796 RepID=A0ABS5AFA1_9PSEU|nr:serine hydrolase [Crossiella equi]MBP2475264.1 CubicO group peptidase (beta-lactamase class C family) [Crossiella equi]